MGDGVGVGEGVGVGVAATNESPTPATASANAMRTALRRKIVVRLLIARGSIRYSALTERTEAYRHEFAYNLLHRSSTDLLSSGGK